ncbi:MAG TPA: glycosyltransferase family 39 protein, partial [Bryobacteraceae bacterium]|nr:glycosyltransferase family 39 protein [Bryobacteraceae bacterium]
MPPDSETPPRTAWRPYVLLAALALACLVPFCEKAFHVDDPLFVWTAQQIVKHPLDPYGFNLVWYTNIAPMSEVTKNPPLAAYYSAAIGSAAGWSEIALHLAFLPFALAVILGTYYLAGRFTRDPMLAATATLLTPAFLVSSTSVMCDTMMLAFWILAAILWLEGLDRMKPALLACSAL